jgi:SAM-dependent methyltransferase
MTAEKGGAMNPFLDGVDPADYDNARPYFHPLVFERLADFFQQRRLCAALDVACGTGQSTEALAGLAEFVVGLDASVVMLRGARGRGVISYVCGLAELLPFPAGAFDLITVGNGFHWFDLARFLGEAHRVLRQPGWLLLYGSGVCGGMRENEAFAGWLAEYHRRFPSPPREPLSAEALAEAGFRLVLSETIVHEETYSLDELIAHLKSYSNLITALREGRETPETLSSWLRASLAPMFRGPTGTFEYRGWVVLFEKDG